MSVSTQLDQRQMVRRPCLTTPSHVKPGPTVFRSQQDVGSAGLSQCVIATVAYYRGVTVMITYTILGVSYYKYTVMGPKPPF